MCLLANTLKLIGKPPYRSLTFTKNALLSGKIPFFVAGQQWYETTFFRKYPAQIIKILIIFIDRADQVKQKINCCEISAELKLCWDCHT